MLRSVFKFFVIKNKSLIMLSFTQIKKFKFLKFNSLQKLSSNKDK